MYNGPDNIDWTQFNILQGCSCKKIFADLGFVGPQYDFDVVFLPEVPTYFNLPLTGVFGQLCFVIDDDIYYKWDPTSSSWITRDTTIVGYPDIDVCDSAQREQRNLYLRNLNQLLLAWKPFTWSTFHIPLYQIYKYKM
jgi:hypothetical protein